MIALRDALMAPPPPAAMFLPPELRHLPPHLLPPPHILAAQAVAASQGIPIDPYAGWNAPPPALYPPPPLHGHPAPPHHHQDLFDAFRVMNEMLPPARSGSAHFSSSPPVVVTFQSDLKRYEVFLFSFLFFSSPQ
jgi:hypothetical protein